MNQEEFNRRRAEIHTMDDIRKKMSLDNSQEEIRTINVLHNSELILDELDKTFEERTSLRRSDFPFLMLATILQILRIYLLPKFQEKYQDEDRLKHDDQEIEEMKKEEQMRYKDLHGEGGKKEWDKKKSKKGYRSWQEIAFTTKVPYDATRHAGEGFHERNMHGGLHRVKSLGHDPVLGWIFGVANIMTDTITICPEYKEGEKRLRLPMVETYTVDMGSNFCWKDKINTGQMFVNCKESFDEDKHRLYAAVFSQGLHLASDRYTMYGLPIPFLSLLDADLAYDIYKEGYDYLDYLYDTQLLRRTFKSAAWAITINKIIGGIHNFFYNPNIDYDRKLYHVRTRKILLYSNTIATSSDIIQTSIRTYIGDETALKDFDLGGFLVTIYRLISDIRYIQKIKEEFIFNEWDKIMFNNDNMIKL